LAHQIMPAINAINAIDAIDVSPVPVASRALVLIFMV